MPSLSGHTVFPNIFAGCICGLVTVIGSISYATLIFSGNCANFLQLGITSALVSATMIGLIMALKSSSPVTIAGPDANISAIIAIIASSVASRSASVSGTTSLFTSLWATLAICSLVTGIFLFVVGRFRMGQWIRFIPYPVVGGFLAGTGWLLVRGSFKVLCGAALSWKSLHVLSAPQALIHWMPGILFALILVVVLRRFRHFLIMPIALVAAIVATHGVFVIMKIPIATAMSNGWLLASFPADLLARSFGSLSFSGFDIMTLAGNSANMTALMMVSAIVILLNAASIELTTRRDVELNRELTATGVANIVAAPLGALTGCTALSRTILNVKAGATNRISGITSALLCGLLLLFGARALSLLPRPVLGGLLLYLGLSLLLEWVWDGWRRLSRFDYFLVIVIIVIIALWGFLPGVGIGLVISCMLFALNYGKTGVIKHTLTGATFHSNVERSLVQQKLLRQRGESIYIVQLQGYIFFGTAYPLLVHLRDCLQSPTTDVIRFFVLDFSGVNGLDSSSILSFSKLLQSAQNCHVSVLFVGITPPVAKLLEQGLPCVRSKPKQAVTGAALIFDDLDYALQWCEDLLLAEEGISGAETTPTFAEHFSDLFHRPELIPRLVQKLERLEVGAGFVLFEQGSPGINLYFLESGEVTAFIDLPREKNRKRLRTMSAGTVIGEMGLYLGTNRSATVIAEKPCVLYRLSAEALKDIEEKDLELACALHRFFIGLLANRLTHANKELAFLLR